MPITYNSDNNTITIIGGSEATPYTFEDIYQADVNGGWGVVEKKETAYFVHAIIQLGNTDNDAWLVDKAKQLYFYETHAFKNPNKRGHLILGEIENEQEKTTKNGCYIECYGNYFTEFNVQEINLFDTEIVSRNPTNKFSFLRVDNCIGKFWNSKFHAILLTGNATDLDMYNIELGNFAQDNIIPPFMYFDIGSGSMEKITVVNCAYAAVHYWYGSFAIKDLIARNIRNALVWFKISTGESFAIDWDVDWDNTVIEGQQASSTKLWRQYLFNVRVQDENDHPIPHAQVILQDNNGDVVYSAMTDGMGKTPAQILNWGYYTLDSNDVCIDYSSTPHTLIVMKDKYQKYKVTFELNKKLIDFPVVLRMECIDVDQEVLL